MTRLLISVRNPAEALLAIDEGADLVDLKEPDAGALGAVSHDVARCVVAAVGKRRVTSATVGDLPLDAMKLGTAIRAMAATGVDLVKMGVWPESGDLVGTFRDLAPVAAATRLIAVVFADQGIPRDIIELAANAGFEGIMLDTAYKRGGRMVDNISMRELGEFVQQAKNRHLLVGLAGSLRIDDVDMLAPLGPDYLGFRGAACDGHARSAELNAERLGALRVALDMALRPIDAVAGRAMAIL